jgi:AraC family ethanolamine operon transcriptional activator
MLLVFPFEGEFRSITGPGFDSYSISIAPSLFTAVATDLGSSAADRVQRSELVRPNARALTALREHLRRVLSYISQSNGLDSVGSVIDVETTELLMEAIADSELVRRPPVRLRDSALRKAEAFIEAASKKPLLVSEVCRASGASWRTLNYAFRETYGMTIKGYLMARRLNGVHQDLRKGDPGTTQVSDIAAGWGFWHLGLLAAQYRELFGELPSETLHGGKTGGAKQASMPWRLISTCFPLV